MPSKIIRDPLYNYIAINLDYDKWLIDLLDCPEVQRLRRIHQLGVTDLAYPGAGHTRLSHTLGVLHLMQQVLQQIEKISNNAPVKSSRERLLAAAVLHDVGHGPFSHLFEPCLDIDHEEWSVRILRDESSKVNHILTNRFDSSFPEGVAKLIEKDNHELPHWQKSLLSSQLDVDRMDYLRRDSLFTGAGYGHFDWYRLINTLELFESTDGQLDIAWPEKAKLGIEEYIFARYYMYQNVYLHKTTRGFEKILEAMWKRAKQLKDDGSDVSLEPAIADYWAASEPAIQQYLRIEEFTVLQQIQIWQDHHDKALGDLAKRFLCRNKFAMVEPPEIENTLEDRTMDWEEALRKIVAAEGYDPVEMYCLRDTLKAKYYQPYFPEKESDEQTAKNAIRVKVDGDPQPIEISQLLPRLEPITRESKDRYRYYVPADIRAKATKLRDGWA